MLITNLTQRICSTLIRCNPSTRVRALLHRTIPIALVTCAAVALGPSGVGSVEPEIVARVNGEPVTRSDLQRMLADPLMQYQFERELGSQKADGKEEERLALQKLIHRHLILQEARRRNITVTEQDFDHTLTALRRRFADVRSFGVWMKERGLDDRSLFDTIRTEMVMRRVMTALVERIRPTEVEVQAYYETHKEDLTIGEEVRLRIIGVKSNKAAEEILAALRKGENFSRLARARSLGLHAAQGGDMGWVGLQTLPAPLQRAVEKLKTGDVGGPLQKSADEFLIVGLEGRRPVRAKSSAEARPEIERRLLHEKQQEAIQTWLKEQENKSKIELFLPPG